MPLISRPMRIEPAFDDRALIRTLFERHAPYRAIAAYAPDAAVDEASEDSRRNGSPLVQS